MNSKLSKGIVCLVVLLALWFSPTPAGLKVSAWHLFAIFLATILGIVLQPLASGSIVLISITLCVSTKLISLGDALRFWSNSTVWLILAAFLFAKGFVKTGLGKRIALILTKKFGTSTLSLAYVLAANDLIMAPATPSNTARAGGVLFPIVMSLIKAFDSHPGPTARKMGSFIILSVVFCDCVTSAMFMTAMVSNPVIADLAFKALGIEISWALWFKGAIVPGILSLIAIPLFLYIFYPPELKKLDNAKTIAGQQLDEMGPIKQGEKIMLIIFIAVLGLWATSLYTKLDSTYIAFLGMSAMLITSVIDWNDVTEEKAAWDVFIWLGGVIGLAGLLAKFGFITWFADNVALYLTGIPWWAAFAAVIIVYYYSHYAFAGMTSHVVLMYIGMVMIAVAAGVPKYVAALSLGYMSSLCASLTHYGTAPAPIYFAAGYVDQQTWWKFGFLVSLINIAIWGGVGSLWWKVLGLW